VSRPTSRDPRDWFLSTSEVLESRQDEKLTLRGYRRGARRRSEGGWRTNKSRSRGRTRKEEGSPVSPFDYSVVDWWSAMTRTGPGVVRCASMRRDTPRLPRVKLEPRSLTRLRLLRNRLSAQQARERKKVYQEGIEARLSQHETVVRSLENECLRLNRENKTLKSLLATAISLRPEQRKVTKV